MQGQNSKDVDAVATLKLNEARLSPKEQALLDYVKVLTLEPSRVRDMHVARLRTVGWKDDQIFEASFITALFAFTNRMADAYGLDYPGSGWLPPTMRKPEQPVKTSNPANVPPPAAEPPVTPAGLQNKTP